MDSKDKELDKKEKRKAILCVSFGTAVGLVVYGIFLYFKIAIFGWNLGLIFAPLAAGYAETILADRLIGQNVGAISAFILFIDTTFYSFILKNPTLGFNLITAGSIFVILQAAFPTLINYIILVVIGGIIANFINTLKKYWRQIRSALRKQQYVKWDGPTVEIDIDSIVKFNEDESNERLNNLDFYFITSTDMVNKTYNIVGLYQAEIILEKDTSLIELEPEKAEIKQLYNLKKEKDNCLIQLAKTIKSNGGNGVLNLSINYNLVGLKGDNIQITAKGMGINIE
ncbi:hypothetical protein [uncultured Methanobrevibacter sp.]|uniref:hypothetical protein n=1 Tax=uncultured Methanobrevibacter sp. TaxID=253161 RepID=UPI0025E6B755|nr:hypothetical protein [uncultured Methanobrevibacter sp.]